MLSLLVPHVERMGWRDDGSHVERRLRSLLLSVACRLGHKESLDNAGRLFVELINNDAYVPANLRTTVYR